MGGLGTGHASASRKQNASMQESEYSVSEHNGVQPSSLVPQISPRSVLAMQPHPAASLNVFAAAGMMHELPDSATSTSTSSPASRTVASTTASGAASLVACSEESTPPQPASTDDTKVARMKPET